MTPRHGWTARRDPGASAGDGPDPRLAGTDPRLVRAVLALYPRRWRERYGQEFASLLTDMTAASRWPGRAVLIANAISGALDARLNPLGGRTMPDRIRRSLAIVTCALVAFTIAGAGFQKMTEYPDFHAAARQHAAVATSFDILVAAAFLAGAAVLAGGLPLAWTVIRQAVTGRRTDLITLLLIPPAAVVGWLAVAVIIASSFSHPRLHSAATVVAATALLLLGAVAAAACAWAVVALLRRADLAPRLLRPQVIPMAVLSACMAVVTGADLAWGLALRSADGPLFHSNNGFMATSLPPSWAGGVLVLAAATVTAAAATVRAGRELRRPA